MKNIGLLLLVGMTIGCKNYFHSSSKVSLKGFNPLTGVHCESSALLNALTHQGYNLTEDEILGAGAVLGFVFEKGKFPFIGGRTLEFKENLFNNLGIKWDREVPGNSEHGWNKIYSLINRDIPVVLRVDMRFLPYLYGGKYGSRYTSFGWHIITLVSLDPQEGVAYVTDTAQKGLQRIKIKDLHRARFSKLKVMPPKGEFYWVEKASVKFTIDWERVTRESLGKIATDMGKYSSSDTQLIGLDGLSKLPEAILELEGATPSYLMEPVLSYIHGFIELYGTGGAAFREPYNRFLESKKHLNSDFQEYSELSRETVDRWKKFSGYIKEMEKDKNKRDFSKLSELARDLYIAEANFYKAVGN